MKTGSRIFRLSPLVLLAVMLIGCIADEVGGIYIVSGEADELNSVANQMTTTYFNAGGKWTAVPSVDWLAVSPSSGEAGKNAIVITTTLPNHTMQERTGTVVITSGGKSETVSVRQRNEFAFFDQTFCIQIVRLHHHGRTVLIGLQRFKQFAGFLVFSCFEQSRGFKI